MNEKNSDEIRYRRLAFKLFDKGKSPTEILSRIPRSRSWLFKWKQRFAQDGWPALDSLSTSPQYSPQQYTPEAVSLVVRVRQRLEKSRVGLISARAIQQELLRLRLLSPPPSQTTIKRWLRQAGLIGAGTESAQPPYYPALPPEDEFVTFSCDWVARYLTGGEKVFVFHTIDQQSLIQNLSLLLAHPEKRLHPISSGSLSIPLALFIVRCVRRSNYQRSSV